MVLVWHVGSGKGAMSDIGLGADFPGEAWRWAGWELSQVAPFETSSKVVIECDLAGL